MKLYSVKLISLALLLLCSGIFVNTGKASASLDGFDPGNIMSDSVMGNKGILSEAGIQSFLKSKNSCNDTNLGRLTSYNSTSGYIITGGKTYYYNLKDGHFVCMADESFNGESAAHIIWQAAQDYSINPQVLIVLLQKEQALITDTWPNTNYQYAAATGFDCPDSGNGCNSANAGFKTQVRKAAELFRTVLNGGWSNYPVGVNYIQYNPNTSCGGSNVNIQNRATSSLYRYTPYQPNAYALNGGSSSAYPQCGAFGNRNFYDYFTGWFGSTRYEYDWSIENYYYSGGDNILTKGQTETATLKARNTGIRPWYNHGDYPVRLATWEPANRASSLLGTIRPSTLQESVVQPGEIGTFAFNITPQSEGTFYESLNLVVDNLVSMNWPGFRPTIVVPATYSWQVQNVIYGNGTGYMEPGDSQLITVIAKNTGSATWSKTTGPPIRLSTWQPDRQSSVGGDWISSTRVKTMNESSVAPGQTAGFQFYVRMPDNKQHYERLNLVAEGQAWFNDVGLTLYLQGNNYAWSIDSVSYSANTGVMAPGSTQTITVKARNIGTATWRNNSAYPIKLGTWQPQRQSQVGATWPSQTRMATLSETSVEPGAVGTFTAIVTMPSTGLYYERMNLLAEGLTWFNDPNLTFYLEGR